jgi:hypothetical protein
MARAVEGIHVYSTEQDINQLAAHQFEDQNLLQGKWNSEVDTLKETQRKEYREWLMKMLEEHQTNVTLPTPMYVRVHRNHSRLFWVLMSMYNTQSYWVFRLCLSSHILKILSSD